MVKQTGVTLRQGDGTCAGNISKLHAEDKAGLVSFSFGLLQNVHRETPALDAVLVQDLDGRLLWRLRILQAADLGLDKKKKGL